MVLVRFLGLLLDLLLFPLRALWKSRAVPEGAFVTLTIDGAVADVVAKPRFWQFRARKATSLHTLATTVKLIAADERVRGLLVTIENLQAGMATASSLRALLATLRAAGKEVIVHLPLGAGTKEVLVAMGASKVYVGPATQLAPLGFLSSTRYFKNALEKVGVEPEVFACGEFKSAGETLVRDSMSDAQRMQLGRLLDSFQGTLVAAIADGRNVSMERARAIVDEAPYFGEECVRAGLCDGVAYEDELPALLGIQPAKDGKKARHELHEKFVDDGDYVAIRERPLLRPLKRPPVIGVIPVHGAIAHSPMPFGGRVATDEHVIRMVRAARRNRRVVGIVLHVDSPGGSALASDRMHHEIVQLAREKPLVVCMSNVAASGGYYVAAPAHRIVCEKTTITGSIGVVAARLTAEPLLARFGIVTETLRRGEHAGLLSPSRPLSDDERAAVHRELEATYRTFVRVVASGRKMREEEVEALARGRVYTGTDALDRGLVDALGGFDTALEELRRLLPVDVRDRAKPQVVKTPRKHVTWLPPPSEGETGRKAAEAMIGAVLPDSARTLLGLAVTGERALALWTGEIR
ncbi:Protease IV [Labilithrix luteola]|uniref:Protease IV n=1 Tax=Labilithrix luteola TaxID=1391654 RepID=A0A0K1PVH4_9BACT|nr:signal peptide peptidase SppA [Labilithrix luteola]AKU97533.1 Protease IV [Labilithrix luteola]